MPVFWGIFAYGSLTSLLGCLIYKNKDNLAESGFKKNEYKNISLFMAIISFALLWFFISYRSSYGDTYTYLAEFESEKYTPTAFSDVLVFLNDSEIKGRGFILLRFIIRRFSSSYVFYFAVLGAFQIGAIIKLFYKFSVNYFMSVYLFLSAGTFVWMMNGIRQYTAACLVFYFFDLVIDKKTIKFLIVVLIASTIHSAVLIWIPVYFIVHFRPWSWEIWVLVLVTVLIVFFVDTFTDILDNALTDSEYAGIGEDMMDRRSRGVDDGVSFVRVVIAAVPAFLAFFKRKDMQDDPKIIHICINLSMVTTAIFLIGTVTSGILVGRLPAYFVPFSYILLPWLLYKKYNNTSGLIIRALCYIFYFLYFYYDMVINGTGYYCSEILNIFYWEKL